MDANKAIQAARDCVTRAIANEGVHQLNFQKAVWESTKKEWHITFCITRTQDKQGTKCAESVCTINVADGQMTSITIDDCPSCDRKCANQASAQDACSAEQNEQPNHATSIYARIFAFARIYTRLDSVRYLYPAFVVAGSAVGLATVLTLFFDGNADGGEKTLMRIAAGAGFFIGLFVGGLRALKHGSQRPDSNKRNRSGK